MNVENSRSTPQFACCKCRCVVQLSSISGDMSVRRGCGLEAHWSEESRLQQEKDSDTGSHSAEVRSRISLTVVTFVLGVRDYGRRVK